jgi:cytochrome c oxidase cbb3-type subunit III
MPRSLPSRRTTGLLLALWSVALSAQTAAPHAHARQGSSHGERGQQVFSSTCGGCHGLDGKGGERAPNIADRPTVQRLSDSQIAAIIKHGVPGTGMPAFAALADPDVTAVVGYLRTLQGAKKTAALPGDPGRGRAVFFGKAQCSSCHMIAGEGGFIASDLSAYAQVHEMGQIRSAILSAPGSEQPVRLAVVTMHGGEKFTGRVRNEDNFSLQLQSLDGTYHFLSKPEVEQMEFESKPLMPSDYGSTLSPAELNDLVSYLVKVAGPYSPGKHGGDWDDP